MSYEAKILEELAIYQNVANVHELPEIFHYWSNKYLRPKLETFGFSDPNDFYIGYIVRVARTVAPRRCGILSLGAGNCDAEVNIAERLLEQGCTNFTFDCLDINAEMLKRGARLSAERQLSHAFNFLETDVNRWIVDKRYDIILANQSLHHFVELELLFEKSFDALQDHGYFLTNDMIGRNGHMRWPEALEFVDAFWSLLDQKHKWNHQLQRHEDVFDNFDCSAEGFEGVRAQDILPLLRQRFGFELFVGFANLISVFVDRSFGHNFDPTNEKDLHFIDFVAGLDDYFIERGKVKPTQMIAAMTRHRDQVPRIYKHLSPEFCVRQVDGA